MTPLNGLILTGGYSRRMGQDKALIDLEGVTLLDRTYNLLSPFMDQAFVSIRLRPLSTYDAADELPWEAIGGRCNSMKIDEH